MKRYSIILKILILFFAEKSYAQNLHILPSPKVPESVSISTPDVMSFQKHGNVPVSLYNGKIDLVVPFYEIQAGKINIPINLTYNSGGIKVDEIASQVGLGWNLNAGGNILVSINDLKDGTLTYQNYGTPLYVPINVGYNRRYFLNNPIYNANMKWFANVDSSPDFYYVNAPGLNNVFTIDDSNYNDYQTSNFNRNYIASFLYPKGHVISPIAVENLGRFQGIGFNGQEDGNPSLNIPTKPADVNLVAFSTFKNFEIINEVGLVYKFSPGNIVETRTLPVLVDPTNARLDPSYELNLNTYNLTSIFDPSTQQQIDFTYETFQIAQPQRIRFLSKNNNIGNNGSCNYGFIPQFEGQPIYSNEKLIKYHTATRLKKIKFNGGEIEFSYLNNRQDYDDKSLDFIYIKDFQGNIIKKYHFIYSYFDSKEGCSEKECKRLRLDQIDEEFPTTTKMYYKFDYYYSNKLPKRFSYEQDFLGYYNNNGYQNTSFIGSSTSGPQPKLFFYPNKGAFSILPFQKTNDTNGREIIGDYSFAPNNYSLTGLLKKVTYETGGFTEFQYENNSFNFEGAEYLAGGARIKSQKINYDSGNIRELKYEYLETTGTTSGYISSIPVFAYPNAQITNPNSPPNQWTPFSFTTYDFDKSGLELTNDNFVGYSRVIEKETGIGSTESSFYSSNDYPDIRPQRQYRDLCGKYLVDNSSFPGKLFENLRGRRGTLKQIIIRDENGNLINKTENTYTYQIFSSINTVYYEPYRITDNEYYPRIRVYNYYVEENSKINRERNLKTKVITTNYSTSGNKVTEQYFTYNENYPFLQEERILDSVSELKLLTFYPFNFSIYASYIPFISEFQYRNRLLEPLIKSTWKNGDVIFKSQINYQNFNNNNLLLRNISSSKGSSSTVEDTTIDFRDDKGNITQYTPAGGASVYIIWGYNKTQPIAKIESNASIAIPTTTITNLQTLSNADNDHCTLNPCTGNEEALRVALNNLRTTYPNAMITTYTYDPLIGVTSITDPKGVKITYEYDSLNRLQFVKDKDGNILRENEYNYKP